MIVDLELETKDKDGKVKINGVIAEDYNPSDAVKERTVQVIKDFQTANITRNKPYLEFNGTSFINRLNLDRLSYNQFVEGASEDPTESWKSRAFRPIVRNKVNAIAAHITAQIIYPKVYAENEHAQEDRDAAVVMRDLMEVRGEQAGYEKAFVHAVLDALTDPIAYLGTEYNEKYRDIKELNEDGKSWTIKKVLDEEFSGFKDYVIPCDEIWVPNVYEPEIQRQPYFVWRRVIHYLTAKAIYRDVDAFKYVTPGLQYLFSDTQQTFFKMYDQTLKGEEVEEVIYFNREADLQLRFVNGILMDDPDQPMKRKDKKYPWAGTGYEFINNRFFYYKSCVFKLANDEEVVNTAYRMLTDASYLQGIPPGVVFGNEEINRGFMVPGSITTIDNTQNEKAGFQAIQTGGNLTGLYNLLEKVESSIGESSSDPLQNGQQTTGQTTAYEISRVEQNARVMLGMFGKMIGFLVKDFGYLCMNDIIQHMTIGEAMEDVDDGVKLKFRSFLLPEKMVNGKSKTRKIEFDQSLPSMMTSDEHMAMSQDLAESEIKDLDDKMQIYKVNPELFRKLKFRLVITPEAVSPRSDALKRAMMLEAYDRAIANPITEKEAITRDLLFGAYEETKSDTDKYIMKTQPGVPGMEQDPNNPLAALAGGGAMGGLKKQINAQEGPISPTGVR